MPPERSLEEVITESAFAELLQRQLVPFGAICNALTARDGSAWTKRHFDQLAAESNALESFLDDYGARFNRTFVLAREIVASVRWFALSGFSIKHLETRLESYGLPQSLGAAGTHDVTQACERGIRYLSIWTQTLVARLKVELGRAKITWPNHSVADESLTAGRTRLRLPRNVGVEEITDESLRIAEVASKYLASCGMLADLGLRRESEFEPRQRLLRSICKEEQARVYEATVHNLQSMYDTYIKNTVTEGRDERLPRLRGHLSSALHLLEAVTFLTHFVERHELDERADMPSREISLLVSRHDVEALILNDLLHWAYELMQRARPTSEELLASYINLQELHVELPDNVRLHARPAALIVNIVSRYGTPVDMEIGGRRCNAGSILELLVAVGSNPEARRYVFRGDVHPLRDIGLLFENSLGEDGLHNLPSSLHYLKSN